MKILHVIPTYLPATRYGGPVFAGHGLCKSLVSQGHEVHVYTTSMDGPADLSVPIGVPVDIDGVKVSYFKADGLRRLAMAPRMGVQLRRQLASFDLLHTHSIFLWPPWMAARAARKQAIPYVMAPRGMLVRELIALRSRVAKTAWLRLLEWSNLGRANALHFTSDLEHAEAVGLGIPMRQAAVIPNGIDLEDLACAGQASDNRDLSELLANGPFVLHLGRISWKKGLDRLVRALQAAPQVQAVIAGNDEEGCRGKLEQLAVVCGVRDRVRFIGPVYGSAKWQLLKAARLFVLPSHSENFGNAVLEAMAAGCPVVITPAVGLADAVRRAGCGMVVDAEPIALAKALNELWANDALRTVMGQNGREITKREYDWPKIASRVQALYQSILEVAPVRSLRDSDDRLHAD